MTLILTQEELNELKRALDIHLEAQTRELVRTDAPRLQHEFHASVRRLEAIRRKLDAVSTAEPPLHA